MKKSILMTLLFLISYSTYSQQDKSEITEKSCFESSLDIIKKASESENVRYFFNNDFLIFLYESENGSKLKLRNISDEKIISVTIIETTFASYKEDNTVEIYSDLKNNQVLNNQLLPNCSSVGVSFKQTNFPNSVKTTVKYIKAVISYSGEEYTITIGEK